MTMLKHSYSTPVERAIEDLRENDYERNPLAMEGLFTDNPRFAQAAARLYIPSGHPIGVLLVDTLGDDFMLAVIENASYLRRWSGTELAVKRVADMAGIGYSYTIANDAVQFHVRPRRGSGEYSEAQIQFLTSVFQTVTPFYLTANIAQFIDKLDLPLAAGGAVNLVDVIGDNP